MEAETWQGCSLKKKMPLRTLTTVITEIQVFYLTSTLLLSLWCLPHPFTLWRSENRGQLCPTSVLCNMVANLPVCKISVRSFLHTVLAFNLSCKLHYLGSFKIWMFAYSQVSTLTMWGCDCINPCRTEVPRRINVEVQIMAALATANEILRPRPKELPA